MLNRYEIIPNTGKVHIYIKDKQGKESYTAIISEVDLILVDSYPGTWTAVVTKHTVYVMGSITKNGKPVGIRLHRWIMRPKDGYVVDHINRNGLDNTVGNLRIVPHYMNQHNRRDTHKSGAIKFKGKWMARIKLAGRKINLGVYKTKQEALEVSQRKREEYFAIFADMEDDGETHNWYSEEPFA